jgi:hypothetical protein
MKAGFSVRFRRYRALYLFIPVPGVRSLPGLSGGSYPAGGTENPIGSSGFPKTSVLGKAQYFY